MAEAELPEAKEEEVSEQPADLDIVYSKRQQAFRSLLVGPNEDWFSGITRGMYGGKAGGGKTAGLVRIVSEYLLNFAGARALAVRKREKDAIRSFTPRFKRLLPKKAAVYNVDTLEWRYANGSTLRYGYLADADDVDQYASEDFDFIWIDEATQLLPEHLAFLYTRLRSAEGFPTKMVITTNPGGPSHAELRKEYIAKKEPGVVYPEVLEAVEPSTGRVLRHEIRRAFVPAHAMDNRWIVQNDPGYLVQLANHPDEMTRKRLWEGDWDIDSGAAFKDWSYDRHVVEPFEIPAHWRRWGGLDFGYQDPFACVWLAQEPETKRIYLYRELVRAELGDMEAKALVRSLSAGERIDVYYADTSARNRSMSSSKTTWDVFAEKPNPIPLMNANKRRAEGWRMLKSLLKDLPDGKPALQVFRNCVEFIDALPQLQIDPHHPEDIAAHKDDHVADCARYALLTRSYAMPGIAAEADPVGEAPLVENMSEFRAPWRRLRAVS